jgi:hypothetical protein
MATVEDVEQWFRSRGFDLRLAEAEGLWWADLVPLSNPASLVDRYGQGGTREQATLRAQQRYEQEQ